MPREIRVDLENEFQLLKEMPCSECQELLPAPEYLCAKCGIQLVFYAKE